MAVLAATPSPRLTRADRTGAWARIGGAIARCPRITWVVTALVLGVMAIGMTGLKTEYLAQRDAFWGEKPDAEIGEEVLVKHFAAGTGAPVKVVASAGSAQPVTSALDSVPKISDVRQVGPPRDGLAYIEGTLNAPPDAQEGFDAIERARDAVHAVCAP